MRGIINAIEEKDRVLEDFIDEGCGSTTVSKMLGRPGVNVDLLRHQIEYGIDHCRHRGIKGNVYLLGSFTDMKNLVPLEKTEDAVFDINKDYKDRVGVEDSSKDLAVCSLALYLVDDEERKRFFKKIHQLPEKW